MTVSAKKFEPKYASGESVFERWRTNVNNRVSPVVYPHSLPGPVIAPGQITLVGGAPGAGKTALVMQATVEALRATPELRAVVANVEMSPEALLDRQLARISGIDGEVIRYRRFEPRHEERLRIGMNTIEAIMDRLAFLEHPFSLDNAALAVDRHRADLLVLDYTQRIAPHRAADDSRSRVNDIMQCVREFAAEGVAIVAVAGLGRSRDKQGRSSYTSDSMGLASYRESSELEYGADDAYILTPESDNNAERMRLLHLKCRHGAQQDLELVFDRARQSFSGFERARDKSLTPRSPRATQLSPDRLAVEVPPPVDVDDVDDVQGT